MIVYVFPFMDRQIFALLVDPIKADLDIPGTQISYLGDFAFALFYPFFGIPNAGMADSKNRKVIISIGLATLSTSAYSLISDRFRSERMAIAISIYSAGVYIGTGLSNIFGGSVIGYAESLDNISLSVIVAVEL
jgi:sugar phosphate permease